MTRPSQDDADAANAPSTPEISVVIPTYGRDGVLIDTLRAVARSVRDSEACGEVLVVDQTEHHEPGAAEQLAAWHASEVIRWVRLPEPSIPASMNVGLREARAPIVLFLDDDITPEPGLIANHLAAHRAAVDAPAVVGRVLQPGEQTRPRPPRRPAPVPPRLWDDLDFPYWSDEPADVVNVMAGNLSVKRDAAISVGGFDENFSGAAYRFETEFARRLVDSAGPARYDPTAGLHHLRAERGGTRSKGGHMASASPRHGAGDYYFALRSLSLRGSSPWRACWHIVRRPLREVRTRFHLRHPWFIPVKWIGEARAAWLAVRLWRAGPRFGQFAEAVGGDSGRESGAIETAESVGAPAGLPRTGSSASAGPIG